MPFSGNSLLDNQVVQPMPGVEVWRNEHGIAVMRLHYSADPAKGDGAKTFIEAVNRELSPWAVARFREMTDPNQYLKEYEIDAESALGAKLFQFVEAATVEPSFPVPESWTRRMSVDPHPGIPHAFLWCATDPWGDRWYYRELWPSKVCFRWERGVLMGKPGPCPQDERGPRIAEYVEAIKWLESEANPENRTSYDAKGKTFDEQIFERVIDYAARAFGKGSNDDPEQDNYQQRYEQQMCLLRMERPYFDDSKKDRQVGIELVNQGLKPREVMGNDDRFHSKSAIHIFGDRCPELIFQLKNNRRRLLTPAQVEKQDPTGKAVQVRTHQTDNLRYIEMCNPIFIGPQDSRSNWRPMADGFSY